MIHSPEQFQQWRDKIETKALLHSNKADDEKEKKELLGLIDNYNFMVQVNNEDVQMEGMGEALEPVSLDDFKVDMAYVPPKEVAPTPTPMPDPRTVQTNMGDVAGQTPPMEDPGRDLSQFVLDKHAAGEDIHPFELLSAKFIELSNRTGVPAFFVNSAEGRLDRNFPVPIKKNMAKLNHSEYHASIKEEFIDTVMGANIFSPYAAGREEYGMRAMTAPLRAVDFPNVIPGEKLVDNRHIADSYIAMSDDLLANSETLIRQVRAASQAVDRDLSHMSDNEIFSYILEAGELSRQLINYRSRTWVSTASTIVASAGVEGLASMGMKVAGWMGKTAKSKAGREAVAGMIAGLGESTSNSENPISDKLMAGAAGSLMAGGAGVGEHIIKRTAAKKHLKTSLKTIEEATGTKPGLRALEELVAHQKSGASKATFKAETERIVGDIKRNVKATEADITNTSIDRILRQQIEEQTESVTKEMARVEREMVGSDLPQPLMDEYSRLKALQGDLQEAAGMMEKRDVRPKAKPYSSKKSALAARKRAGGDLDNYEPVEIRKDEWVLRNESQVEVPQADPDKLTDEELAEALEYHVTKADKSERDMQYTEKLYAETLARKTTKVGPPEPKPEPEKPMTEFTDTPDTGLSSENADKLRAMMGKGAADKPKQAKSPKTTPKKKEVSQAADDTPRLSDLDDESYEKAIKKEAKRRQKEMKETPIRDAVQVAGGIRPRNTVLPGGEYDGRPGIRELGGYAKGLKGSETPDVVAQVLYDDGLLDEPSPDALWRAIKDEADAQKLGRYDAEVKAEYDMMRRAEQMEAVDNRIAELDAEMDNLDKQFFSLGKGEDQGPLVKRMEEINAERDRLTSQKWELPKSERSVLKGERGSVSGEDRMSELNQQKWIHIKAREIDGFDVYKHIYAQYGVDSTKKLTHSQAIEVANHIRKMGMEADRLKKITGEGDMVKAMGIIGDTFKADKNSPFPELLRLSRAGNMEKVDEMLADGSADRLLHHPIAEVVFDDTLDPTSRHENNKKAVRKLLAAAEKDGEAFYLSPLSKWVRVGRSAYTRIAEKTGLAFDKLYDSTVLARPGYEKFIDGEVNKFSNMGLFDLSNEEAEAIMRARLTETLDDLPDNLKEINQRITEWFEEIHPLMKAADDDMGYIAKYTPRWTKKGEVILQKKAYERITDQIRPLFMEARIADEIPLDNLELDVRKIMVKYAQLAGKVIHYNPTLARAAAMKKLMKAGVGNNAKIKVVDYMDQQMARLLGKPDDIAAWLNKRTFTRIPAQMQENFRKATIVMLTNISSMARDMTQPIYNTAPMLGNDAWRVAKAYGKISKSKINELRERGVIAEVLPENILNQDSAVNRAVDKAVEFGTTPRRWMEYVNRFVSYTAAYDAAMAKLPAGLKKVKTLNDAGRLAEKIHAHKLEPVYFRRIRKMIWDAAGGHKGVTPEDIAHQLGVNINNITQFRYDVGESPEMMNNMLGRTIFQFATWDMHYIHMLSQLIRNVGNKEMSAKARIGNAATLATIVALPQLAWEVVANEDNPKEVRAAFEFLRYTQMRYTWGHMLEYANKKTLDTPAAVPIRETAYALKSTLFNEAEKEVSDIWTKAGLKTGRQMTQSLGIVRNIYGAFYALRQKGWSDDKIVGAIMRGRLEWKNGELVAEPYEFSKSKGGKRRSRKSRRKSRRSN